MTQSPLSPGPSLPEAAPAPPSPSRSWRREPRINAVLFVLTCLSTWAVQGPAYAAALMTILLCHEMGHYTLARIHRVRTSLPFFIPMPLSILGTFGAIIVARSPFPTRREIFDVGVAGPIAGFVVALPAWIVGMALSTTEPRAAFEARAATGLSIEFGDSLITWITAQWFFPGLGTDAIIIAHPLAIAGWVGLILTAINLLPAGNLDGGHISYAFFWRHHRRLSVLTAIGMVLLGSRAIVIGAGAGSALPISIDFDDPHIVWLFWALLVSVFALNHPPPLDPYVPMTRGRRWVALASLCIFILTFVPAPLRIAGEPGPEGAPHESEFEHDPAPERRDAPRPDSNPGGGRSLDVHAGPAIRVSLRYRPS